MKPGVNRLLAVGTAVCAWLCVFPHLGAAIEGPSDTGENRWVPSLAVVAGATFQDQRSTVQASDLTNTNPLFCSGFGLDELDTAPFPCREGGTDLAVSPFVGGNVQLMAPALPIPTRPRFFLSGEILPTFASSRLIAKQGSPTGFVEPTVPDQLSAPNSAFGEATIRGTGMETKSTVETLAFGAAFGIAFPFELFGRQLRVKPSAAWYRYEVRVSGVALRAICRNTSGECNPLSGAGSPLMGGQRRVQLYGEESDWFNGIGPGLEFELDAGRWGPIGLSLFLNGAAYKVLGDRTIEFGDVINSLATPLDLGLDASGNVIQNVVDPVIEAQQMCPAEGCDYSARWSWEADPWIFRAGLGLRFQWFGSGQ